MNEANMKTSKQNEPHYSRKDTFKAVFNSSSIGPPQILSPPLPVPVGSPVCTIKSLILR